MPQSYSARLQAWLSHPFRADMDAVNWALAVMFAVTVAYLWTRVLRNIG